MRALAAVLVVLWTAGGVLAADEASVLDLRVARRDGTVTTTRELVGDRPAVLAFWATYCAPCRAEVPVLNRAVERWRDQGLRVIGIALEPDDARVRETSEAWGMRYDIHAIEGGQQSVIEKLFPKGLPASAFIARGEVTLHERLLDDASLERLVLPLLGSPTPAQ